MKNNNYLKLLQDKDFLESKEFKKLKKEINEYIKNEYLKFKK